MDKEKSNLRSLSWIDSLPPYRLLHLAAANLDLDHVREILSNNKVDINNVEGFGQGKRSGQKPGHLYQHFYYSQRTTAICQLFENVQHQTWKTLLWFVLRKAFAVKVDSTLLRDRAVE